MVVDIHTHTFPVQIAERALRQMQSNCHTALFSDGTEKGLIDAKQRAQVDIAVVQPVATNPEKVPHINDRVILTNQTTCASGILSFGAMHPAYPKWEAELERLKTAGVPGIKLHPPYQKIDIDDPRSISVLRKCRDIGLIVLIHSGIDVGLPGAEEALPEKVRNAVDKVGPLNLIAAHMGGWGCWSKAKSLLSDTGIFIDTAFSLGTIIPAKDDHPWDKHSLQMLNQDAFMEFINEFGVARILFGTDSPWTDPATELAKIEAMPLSKGDFENITYKNAKQLLALT